MISGTTPSPMRPARIFTSVPQMPTFRTRTSTSPGPIAGTATSRRTSGPPNSSSTHARMVSLPSPGVPEDALVHLEIGRRETAESDFPDGRMLLPRVAHRPDGDRRRQLDRVAVDAGADARERERREAVRGRDLDAAPVARREQL